MSLTNFISIYSLLPKSPEMPIPLWQREIRKSRLITKISTRQLFILFWTFTSGKEFNTGQRFKNRIIGVNVKVVYTGGFRSTPINVDASKEKGETVYYEQLAFTNKNSNYFRTDLRISLKRNRAHSTHTMSLDLQNATNRKNIYGEFFDPQSARVKTYYQSPLIPIFSYKIEFWFIWWC